jgi:D-3-phosphoglycerate dehydrogenase
MQNCIEDFRDQFDARGIAIDLPQIVQQPTEAELIAMIGDYDGMIAGDDPLTASVLSHAARLKIISKWGVGIDGIDLDAARTHGIAVTNTPDVFGDDVADVAAGYLVMLARQLHRIDASVRDGGWFKHEGVALARKTLGIVGYGSVGQALGRRGHGFGMTVIATDTAPGVRDVARFENVELVERESAFGRSDFLALCVPLTSDTKHLVNAATLGLMPQGSFLVNVARGGLVDESALVAALDSGHLAAVALDVFEDEPLPADSPLRAFPQCVFGTHNGSNTHEGVLRASAAAVENLIAGLEKSV